MGNALSMMQDAILLQLSIFKTFYTALDYIILKQSLTMSEFYCMRTEYVLILSFFFKFRIYMFVDIFNILCNLIVNTSLQLTERMRERKETI